jgi:hypothetical protein
MGGVETFKLVAQHADDGGRFLLTRLVASFRSEFIAADSHARIASAGAPCLPAMAPASGEVARDELTPGSPTLENDVGLLMLRMRDASVDACGQICATLRKLAGR